MPFHRFLAFLIVAMFAVLMSAAGQSTPLTRELQREAGAAYAQSVLEQANAQNAAKEQAENQASNASYDAIADRLRAATPGFSAYSDFRFSQEPGKKHYYSGSRNTVLEPWNPAEHIQKLRQYRDEYDQLGGAQRQNWEAKGAAARPAPAFGGNTALQTGSLSGSNLPERTPSPRVSQVSPQPDSSVENSWLGKQIAATTSAPIPATVAGSQAEAVNKYPPLKIQGSPLNREFVARVQKHRSEDPQIFQDPSWPMKIADEADAALGAGTNISR